MSVYKPQSDSSSKKVDYVHLLISERDQTKVPYLISYRKRGKVLSLKRIHLNRHLTGSCRQSPRMFLPGHSFNLLLLKNSACHVPTGR